MITSTTRKAIVTLAAAAALVGGIAACEPVETAKATNPAPAAVGAEYTAPEVVETVDSSLTTSQRNAVAKGESYLATMAFSRSGLIEQLEFEGFDTEDATFAVDHIAPDWSEQAVKKAESYMNTMPFSQSGLVDQLVFEGFTQAQAEHGAASQF